MAARLRAQVRALWQKPDPRPFARNQDFFGFSRHICRTLRSDGEVSGLSVGDKVFYAELLA